MLEVEQLSASYAGVPALFDVSFRIDEGEIATIIGANGAGKTTILRALSGVQAEPAGHVRFLDQRTSEDGGTSCRRRVRRVNPPATLPHYPRRF